MNATVSFQSFVAFIANSPPSVSIARFYPRQAGGRFEWQARLAIVGTLLASTFAMFWSWKVLFEYPPWEKVLMKTLHSDDK